ncbi:hypothetical protein ACM0CQ_02555 [Mycobacteroides abscessus subsp. abscessus]|uniref:hypothetical protein n=1 Tax=Mycobacteroides abscessus TaxID=36809 RepID=UPI0039EFAC4D
MTAFRGAVAGLLTILITATTLTTAPLAHAAGKLTVGMKVIIGNGSCSLGFFAFNDAKNRLAVTSGHCSHETIHEPVYAVGGIEIGNVVAYMTDSTTKKAVRPRGYTIFRIYDRFGFNPTFVDTGSATKGDAVGKEGAASGFTKGQITDTYFNKERPDMATLIGNVVTVPGDSGGPWFTAGPTLVGITASGSYAEGADTDRGSQAQSIGSLVTVIREHAGEIGQGFKVWLED